VLGMYFAEARMYDAGDRRFAAVDPVFGDVADPTSLNPYVYVLDNPLKWVDPLGLEKAVVSLMGSSLSATVDTDSMDSVIQMLNMFTYANVSGLGFSDDSMWVYSLNKDKIFTVNFREGMSVKDIFSAIELPENTSTNRHDEIYFMQVICIDGLPQYQISGATLGSDTYNNMVMEEQYRHIGVPVRNDLVIDRIMRDVNAWENIDDISYANFKSLGALFSKMVVENGQWFSIDEDIHYFRNILNRPPKSIAEIVANKDEWVLFGINDSAYHMFGENAGFDASYMSGYGGEFNLKFVSNDGHYEAVFMPANYDAVKDIAGWWKEYDNWKLVGDETNLERANMGTYNYSFNNPNFYLNNIYHFLYDMYPYENQGYGNVKELDYLSMKNLGYTDTDENKLKHKANPNAVASWEYFNLLVNK
jgi:RHS repeat-associated protein